MCASIGVGLAVGVIAGLALAPFAVGFLRDYTVLLSSLTAYGVSAIVCTLVTVFSKAPSFDFELIKQRVTEFNTPAASNSSTKYN